MVDLIKRLAGSRARIALIDADSVLYGIALSAMVHTQDGDTLEVKDGEECYKEVVDRLESLVNAVDASDALVCLTPTGVMQFRSKLLPSYKQNRVASLRPGLLKPLQNMLQDRRPFGCLAVRGIEADDCCGISSTNLQKAALREPVVVSIDKDLKSIPGLLFNWLHRERGIVEVSGAEADRAHLYQTLVGDTTDNYTGLPGIGPKRADRILDELADASPWSRWEWIVGQFNKRGFSEEYALTQARVARILRAEDWDNQRREIKLWTPASLPLSQPLPTVGSVIAPHVSTAVTASLRLSEVLPKPGETCH